MKHQPNRLINASSPYLLQHAHNPVDWYEWGEEALAKAQAEDKPILVSIGYSSCHWCHVMERESFEQEAIAKVMNDYFVCIKVDREERPDIDQIYMDAVQALGVNGGWPLNVFLTPQQKPFFGGTYFAPSSWTQVLTNIDKAFKLNRQQIEDTSEELRLHLLRSEVERFVQKPNDSDLLQDLHQSYEKLESNFDSIWGGMDRAPKFIMPSVWLYLLRYYYLTLNKTALDHILLTLKRIGMGGIYDQAGGGFARYSVDQYWFAPHFEKMLYDNAQLVTLYSEAYRLTQDESFKTIVYETLAWLDREMTHSSGGFYSALDADSEGIEGKFYCWTQPEFNEVLGDDAALVGDYYRMMDDGNWEHGMNILMREKSDEVFLMNHQLQPEAWSKILEKAKKAMMERRASRVRPGLDDKIITSWNAMMISGLVQAHKAFREEAFLTKAVAAIRFLENELIDGAVIFRSFKDKRSNVHAFLDDYAFVIRAYIDLYTVTFDAYYLKRAVYFMNYTITQFYDTKDGFFFYTAEVSPALIARKKEIFDNVIPSSNSVMAQNLHHLGILADRDDWKHIAETMSGSLAHLVVGEPNYMSHWGIVLMEVRNGMSEVAVVGKECADTAAQLNATYNPFMLTMGMEKESELPLLEGKIALDDKTTIYVCYNKSCRLPVHRISDALDQIISKHPAALRH
ncbi:thioredoxin domain-containing protein [Pseudochryseolinea flava]|uniref:Thioredoxin domain-containing protein n=1 Tax=Pseudochryseolinea flava TaxID=2059302 RepID=A0A364XYM0_9BACT|nr:thioredoxin domain-containing protein [Pseudochryseolinea flava]RAV99599.1 thioredoxin domain-containing protein [Pseudochryseolinea flava]